MSRKFPVLVMVLLMSMVVSACGGGGSGQTGAATTAPAAAPAATTAPAAAAPTTAAAAEATTAPTTAAAEPTTAAAEPTTAAAAEATTAPTTAAAEPTAAGAAAATEVPAAMSIDAAPTGLRTDLKGVKIKAIQGADGPSIPWEKAAAAKFTELTGIEVQLIAGDQSATDRLATYLQQVNAGSGDVDVYMIDVIWPGIMAEYAEDLNPSMGESMKDFFPAIVENNTVDGKLVGVPWYTDAGLLYYRKDLLEKYGYKAAPTTWAELEEMATKIQEGERAANKDFYGFVWQGNAYEGLTCDALEWQVSNGGGSIIEPDGTISVNNDQVAAALDRAKGWIGTISPEGVTTYKEEDARGVWQGGNAAFMRNWPYAYSLGQGADSKIKDKIGVAVLPKGDGPDARNAATLGGWQLMVSSDSKNKEAAIEYVKFMTSPELMTSHAVELSRLPTRPVLYENADVLKANPFFGELLPVFAGGAVARPSTVSADLYNDVSTAYFNTVNQVLTGQKESKAALAELETELKSILK